MTGTFGRSLAINQNNLVAVTLKPERGRYTDDARSDNGDGLAHAWAPVVDAMDGGTLIFNSSRKC
jgi:hypothetical protein